MERKTLKPRKLSGKDSFVLDITDRATGKRTARGLDTSDQSEAEAIAFDYCRLLERNELLIDPSNHIYDLLGFKFKAVELVFGKDSDVAKKLREHGDPKVGLTSEDFKAIEQQVTENAYSNADALQIEAIDNPAGARRVEKIIGSVNDKSGNPVPIVATHLEPTAKTAAKLAPVVAPADVVALLEKFIPVKVRALNEQVTSLTRENGTLRARLADASLEIDRLRKLTNAHVTITLADAFTALTHGPDWKARAPQTQKEMKTAFDSLLATLPADFPLSKLKHTQIQSWFDNLKRIDTRANGMQGKPLSDRSRQKARAYVQSIANTLYRNYDLAESPTEKLSPITTPKHDRYDIEAIRSPEDLTEMLNALKQVDSYWYAFVAFHILATPRYSEAVRLHVADVDFAMNTIDFRGLRDEQGNVLKGTKTGARRKMPIEQTVLLPILTEHVARRKTERDAGATPAEKSVWLFPTTLSEHEFLIRKKSQVGQWSHAKAWHNAYAEIVKKAQAITGERYYWAFGPDEFRHSGATCLGNSGVNTDDGATWSGNSPKVFTKHYRAPSSGGAKWPFKY